MEEEKKQLVDLNKLKEGMMGSLVEVGIIDEQGIRVSGNGIIIKQLGDLKILIDKTNLKLYGLGKEIEKLRMIIDEKIPKL